MFSGCRLSVHLWSYRWRYGDVGQINEVALRRAGLVSTGMSDHIRVQLSVRETYLGLTNHPGQLSLALHPCGVTKLSTSFCWDKCGKVATAGWQVTLSDPIWYVISRSSVMILIMNCYIRLTLLYIKSL